MCSKVFLTKMVVSKDFSKVSTLLLMLYTNSKNPKQFSHIDPCMGTAINTYEEKLVYMEACPELTSDDAWTGRPSTTS